MDVTSLTFYLRAFLGVQYFITSVSVMNISLRTALYGGAGLPSVTEHPNLKSRSLSSLKIKPMRSSSKIKGRQNVQAGGGLGSRVLTGATRGWSSRGEAAADASSLTRTQVPAPGSERLCSRPVFVYARSRACACACAYVDTMLLNVHLCSLHLTQITEGESSGHPTPHFSGEGK